MPRRSCCTGARRTSGRALRTGAVPLTKLAARFCAEADGSPQFAVGRAGSSWRSCQLLTASRPVPTLFHLCPPRPTQARNASASCAGGSATSRCVQGMLDTPFYIACLRLTGRRCVVVGGGDVGLEKVEGLLACDGDVVLVAPDAIAAAAASSPPRARSAGSGASTRPEDLEGTFIVIAATDDTDVNIRVYEDAERRAMLVNVVDVPPLCNFILPAIVRTGPLAIAISTAGASPALAKRIKREIAERVRRALRAPGGAAQRGPRLGQGHAAHLPGPQGVLRGDRQRRPRPGRAAARRATSRPCAT